MWCRFDGLLFVKSIGKELYRIAQIRISNLSYKSPPGQESRHLLQCTLTYFDCRTVKASVVSPQPGATHDGCIQTEQPTAEQPTEHCSLSFFTFSHMPHFVEVIEARLLAEVDIADSTQHFKFHIKNGFGIV